MALRYCAWSSQSVYRSHSKNSQLSDNYTYLAWYFLFPTAVLHLICDLFPHIITNYSLIRTDKDVCVRTVPTQTYPKQSLWIVHSHNSTYPKCWKEIEEEKEISAKRQLLCQVLPFRAIQYLDTHTHKKSWGLMFKKKRHEKVSDEVVVHTRS